MKTKKKINSIYRWKFTKFIRKTQTDTQNYEKIFIVNVLDFEKNWSQVFFFTFECPNVFFSCRCWDVMEWNYEIFYDDIVWHEYVCVHEMFCLIQLVVVVIVIVINIIMIIIITTIKNNNNNNIIYRPLVLVYQCLLFCMFFLCMYSLWSSIYLNLNITCFRCFDVDDDDESKPKVDKSSFFFFHFFSCFFFNYFGYLEKNFELIVRCTHESVRERERERDEE